MEFSKRFFIPEYAKHKATYLLWPSRRDNWRNSGFFAQRDVALLANAISVFEPVVIGTNISIEVELSSHVKIVRMAYDDIWVRDTGPTFYRQNNTVCAVDWDFNSWGGLLPTFDKDRTLPSQIAKNENLSLEHVDFVFEGGSYVPGGDGTIFCVKNCVLDTNRNPNTDISSVESLLKTYLCAKEVVWFQNGFKYDETGGHADNILFFSDENNIFISVADNPNNPNYPISHECLDIVSNFNKITGNRFSVHRLPLPMPLEISLEESRAFVDAGGGIVREPGTPMCASYSNSLVINGAIIIPKFGIPEDDKVANIIGEVHPEKSIIQIPSREFVLGGGAVHCITKEIPV